MEILKSYLMFMFMLVLSILTSIASLYILLWIIGCTVYFWNTPWLPVKYLFDTMFNY